MSENASLQNTQKKPTGKIIASAIFGAISIVLFIIYAVMGSGAISLKTGETEGLEALGVALGLVIVVFIMLIGLVLINIFDIIWLIGSVKNLVSTIKSKSNLKIYYIVATAVSSIILIAAWAILLIFLVSKGA